METYIHTLIAVDPEFVPQPSQVVDFLAWITTQGGLDTKSPTAFQPGFHVIKPSTTMRKYHDPWTGEIREMPGSDRVRCDGADAISSAVEGLQHYGASASGNWNQGKEPLALFTPDEKPFAEVYYGRVACELRECPVSMSSVDLDMGAHFANEATPFGEPCDSVKDFRLYSNPWTGNRIEAHGASCARFWIEFQSGDFLLPKIDGPFEVMNPAFVAKAEQCFGVKFVQGWTYY